MKKFIVVFDGPPASGKTVRSNALALKLHCPLSHYKSLGLANVMSSVILRLTTEFSRIPVDYVKRRRYIVVEKDPVLLIEKRLLVRIRYIIFLTELLYKTLQVLKLITISLLHKCLIIDEFLALRMANYVNVYLHGGLEKWQAILLMRLDIALLTILSRMRNIRYVYICRDISDLRKLWLKRSNYGGFQSEEYDARFTVLVQISWRKSKEIIQKFAKTHELELRVAT